MCTREGVKLKDGGFISASTVVCTIGSRPLPMIEQLEIPKDKGRIAVNADMSVSEYQNVWAIGDCAAVTNNWTENYHRQPANLQKDREPR